MAGLRTRLYAQVGQEIAAINKAFLGREFRIGAVDFTCRSMMGQLVMDSSRGTHMMSAQAKATPAVAEKLTANARVIVTEKVASAK